MGPPVDAVNPWSSGSPSPALCRGSRLLMSMPRSQGRWLQRTGVPEADACLPWAEVGSGVFGCGAKGPGAGHGPWVSVSMATGGRGLGPASAAGGRRIEGHLELMRAQRRAIVLGHVILGWVQELRLLDLNSRSP